MKILIVTPAPSGSRQGNRVTADRWANLFCSLGHNVTLAESYFNQPCDLLIALHARKSARSVVRFRDMQPDKPLIVVLTGTDVYHDLPASFAARRSLKLADRLVVLQSLALEQLPTDARQKTRVIVQSAVGPGRRIMATRRDMEICVIGHLRPVKDPFRTALAVRRISRNSRIRVTHLGAALSPAMERRAIAEMKRNSRYRWLGDLSREATLRRLANSDLLVNSSKMEGGANAICEALACGVPVIASRIDGSIGLLGRDYPGYFDVGNTTQLMGLLSCFETDAVFRGDLRRRCHALRSLVEPTKELRAWKSLFAELRSIRV